MKFLKQLFRHTLVEGIIIAGLLLCTGAVLFAPNIYWMRTLSHFALYIMLLELGAAFFFMIIDAKRLMYLSLICCGILCVFLKRASNENLVLPDKNLEVTSIRMGLFNVSRFTENLDEDMELIRSLDADILFFHEVTPEWESFLSGELSTCYDFQYLHVRIDPFGQAIFSKVPLIKLDTAHFEDKSLFTDIPALGVTFALENQDTFRCTSIHSLPPTGNMDYEKLGSQLSQIGQELISEKYSNFVFAYLNVPAWNNEVQNFRYVYSLKDSRRVSKLFKMPYEHILYSPDLECIGFSEEQNNGQYIGLIGTYQKTLEVEAGVD